MSQVIKIKRGGISGLSGASTVQGELIIATGSLGNNVDGPFLLAHGDSLGLVAGAVFTGSTVPTITDSELNGILFYDDANSKFIRLDTNGNQSLDIEATGFSGDTDGVSEGSTNLYYTDARVKTKLNTESVVSGSKANVLSFLNVEDGADVTDATNVQAAGALMDSEVTNLDDVKSFDPADYATAAQGTAADSALQNITGESVTDLTDVTNAGSGIIISAAERTKLNGIEANADVTDATNVEAAGALMDSEVTNLAQVKAFDSSDYATSAQGALADSALQSLGSVTGHTDVTNAGSGIIISAAERTKLGGIEASADVTDATNVQAAGALMDSELSDIAAVKALNQGVATTDSPTFTGLTVTGNASIQGTLTTVNSNDVNIGDRIITLNTADGAGDAGIQVHDTNGAQTGSLLWDTDGNYWKVGVVGGTDYRLVEWDGETAGAGDFVVTNADGRIDALATSTAGDMLISDGDGTFTVTNEIDGGTY